MKEECFIGTLSSEVGGRDMYFHLSSFNVCFISITNIVTQGNKDLEINYMVFFCEDLCYFFNEFMADNDGQMYSLAP